MGESNRNLWNSDISARSQIKVFLVQSSASIRYLSIHVYIYIYAYTYLCICMIGLIDIDLFYLIRDI
jgi:hypothetical protein